MKQKQSKESLMKLISTITFWVGLALCAYAVFALIMEGSSLTSFGSKPMMIASVALLLTSFVTSFFTGKRSGKTPDGKE
jgi:FtsH-binding integral membrane protein